MEPVVRPTFHWMINPNLQSDFHRRAAIFALSRWALLCLLGGTLPE